MKTKPWVIAGAVVLVGLVLAGVGLAIAFNLPGKDDNTRVEIDGDINETLAQVAANQALLSDNITDTQAEVATLDNKINVVEPKVDSLDSDVSGLQASVSALGSDVSGVQSSVSTLNSDVSGVQSSVAALDSDVSGVQSSVSILNSDVSGLQSSVAALDSDVSGVQSSVSILNSDVSGVQSSVSTLNSDVSGLQSSVSSLETFKSLAENKPYSYLSGNSYNTAATGTITWWSKYDLNGGIPYADGGNSAFQLEPSKTYYIIYSLEPSVDTGNIEFGVVTGSGSGYRGSYMTIHDTFTGGSLYGSTITKAFVMYTGTDTTENKISLKVTRVQFATTVRVVGIRMIIREL